MGTIIDFFTNAGAPSAALTPVITIYNMAGTVITAAQNMTIVGNGIYSYAFASESNKRYSYYIDAGVALGGADERYHWGEYNQEIQQRHIENY